MVENDKVSNDGKKGLHDEDGEEELLLKCVPKFEAVEADEGSLYLDVLVQKSQSGNKRSSDVDIHYNPTNNILTLTLKVFIVDTQSFIEAAKKFKKVPLQIKTKIVLI